MHRAAPIKLHHHSSSLILIMIINHHHHLDQLHGASSNIIDHLHSFIIVIDDIAGEYFIHPRLS
jgi:hypothetical protein